MKVLTWNLAMLERSSEAPPGWSMGDTEAAIRDAVMSEDPDVVCFQELPRLVPYIEILQMIPANPSSHSGELAVLVRPELMDPLPSVAVVPECGLMVTFPSLELTIVNVHLSSGRADAPKRLAQLRAMATHREARLLVIGDTNTRVGEEDTIAELGLAGERPPRATWNSRRNRFRQRSPEFLAYFTRWFATTDVEVSDVRVLDSPVEGPSGQKFHLSDHYALTLNVE